MSKSKKRTDRQTLIAVQKDSAQEGFGQTVNDDVVDAKWQGRWYPAKLISMTSDGKYLSTCLYNVHDVNLSLLLSKTCIT